MKIIIAGAGNLGYHLAELLSFENMDITLIDNNKEVLDHASLHLDVMTVLGDSASIDLLEDLDVAKVQLLLAVTAHESTNLITAILAKRMGVKQVIARVESSENLTEERKKMFQELGIDSIFSPKYMAAKEIVRLLERCTFTDMFEFEGGKIYLVGITLNESSPLVDKRLNQLHDLQAGFALRLIAVHRGHHTIIPDGNEILRRNDHVYFISTNKDIDKIEQFVGGGKKEVKNVMMLGGTGLAYETARLVENEYNITIIEGNKERCKFLSEKLTNTLIIHGRPDNFDLMRTEGLDNMDAFLALTANAETNIIACLNAKNAGVYKTIAQVENKEYTLISQNIGVDTLINIKLVAANNIFRYVRKGRVEALTALHGVDAEIIEFSLTKNNQLTKKPIKDLHFPKQALIGGVIRGEESFIPDGNFEMQIHDKVIVFSLPEAIAKVESLFR